MFVLAVSLVVVRAFRPHLIVKVKRHGRDTFSFGVSPRREVNGLWVTADAEFSIAWVKFAERITDILLCEYGYLTCRVRSGSTMPELLSCAGFVAVASGRFITRMEKRHATERISTIRD